MPRVIPRCARTVRSIVGTDGRMGGCAVRAGALVLALSVVGLTSTRSVTAQGLSLGVQASNGEKSDFGIGPRAILDLGPFDAGLRLIGSFDLFFPSNDSGGTRDINYWEANANLVYTLGLPLVPITPYFGGGLNVARTDITDTTGGGVNTMRTDEGVNVLAGVELSVAWVSPFVEIRYEVQGGEQWVVTGGIVF